MGRSTHYLGELAVSDGQLTEAYSLLQKSIAFLHSEDARGMISQPLAALGIVELKLKKLSHARLRLAEALLLVNESRDYETALYILTCALLIMVAEDKIEGAVELFALVSIYPYFTNSAFIHDLVGEPFAALSTTLPPEVFTAAQERGRVRDLWATIDELLAEFGGDPH